MEDCHDENKKTDAIPCFLRVHLVSYFSEGFVSGTIIYRCKHEWKMECCMEELMGSSKGVLFILVNQRIQRNLPGLRVPDRSKTIASDWPKRLFTQLLHRDVCKDYWSSTIGISRYLFLSNHYASRSGYTHLILITPVAILSATIWNLSIILCFSRHLVGPLFLPSTPSRVAHYIRTDPFFL